MCLVAIAARMHCFAIANQMNFADHTQCCGCNNFYVIHCIEVYVPSARLKQLPRGHYIWWVRVHTTCKSCKWSAEWTQRLGMDCLRGGHWIQHGAHTERPSQIYLRVCACWNYAQERELRALLCPCFWAPPDGDQPVCGILTGHCNESCAPSRTRMH